MKNSIYEFVPEDADRFAQFLNANRRRKGNELQFKYCPYCHGGRHKDKDTFSINLETGVFNCQRASCSIRGNMITLAKDFNFPLSDDVSRYLESDDYAGRFRAFENKHKKSTNRAVDYLGKRGIPKEVVERYEITTKTDNDNILVFPFTDEKDQIWFIKYRNMDYKVGDPGGKEWCEKDRKPILFGMKQCDPEKGPLVITEGQIDSLSLAAAGIENAVSVPIGKNGFTWIPHCWDFVNQFEEIIVFGDREGEEITLAEEIISRFRYKTVRVVQPCDYLGEKDANDILTKHGAEILKLAVAGAKSRPIKKILDASEIPDLDPDAVERIPTGFKPLDKMLDGGLPTGGVTIVSGYTGEGKSTFAQQLILNAVENGYKSFIYSGELSNELLKSWLMRQAAGEENIETYIAEPSGSTRYRVKDYVRPRINKWMREQLYIFDNSIDEQIETEGIIKTLRMALAKYGIKVALIDNLMTAIDLSVKENTDTYESQGKFVNDLAQIAIEFDALIILVAHRKKNGGVIEGDNESIMGSSRIGNLCMVNLYYGKDTRGSNPTAPDERKIRIGKNRITGEVTEDGITVKFEPTAKRIYLNTKEGNSQKYRPIGWNKVY